MESVVSRMDARVALVTGAARGMGRAIARRLHELGASVALNDLDPKATSRVAEELGEDVLPTPADVTSSDPVREMVATTLDRFGRLDILVNNAGILFPTPLEEISEEEWRRTLDVNLTGVFFCTQAVIDPMKREGVRPHREPLFYGRQNGEHSGWGPLHRVQARRPRPHPSLGPGASAV